MPADYQLVAPIPGTLSDAVLRVSDGVVIPFNPASHDYHAYLGWVALGGITDAAPPYVPPVPPVLP
jgi:hypothetical protein